MMDWLLLFIFVRKWGNSKPNQHTEIKTKQIKCGKPKPNVYSETKPKTKWWKMDGRKDGWVGGRVVL